MRLLFLLLFFPKFIIAQSAFFKDPDIIWATEIEQDWVVDVPSLDEEWHEGITTLKLLCKDPYNSAWLPTTLSALVTYAAISGKMDIYKDPACTLPTDWHSVFKYSDNHSFDPETFEVAEVSDMMLAEPQAFKRWRLRQVLAYHQKSATWTSTLESVAPLMTILNAEGDSVDIRPLFWFKPDNSRKNLNSSQILWAKRTVNRPAKTQVSIIPAKPEKFPEASSKLISATRHLVEHQMNIPLYHRSENRLLSPEERREWISQTDTVFYCFNDGPNGALYDLVQTETHHFERVHELRLVQTWYWDERRSRLSICLDAVAPMVDVVDQEGNFRFSTPMFYRRSKN